MNRCFFFWWRRDTSLFLADNNVDKTRYIRRATKKYRVMIDNTKTALGAVFRISHFYVFSAARTSNTHKSICICEVSSQFTGKEYLKNESTVRAVCVRNEDYNVFRHFCVGG